MPPLRFILVGLGARAQYWIRLLNESPDCELVGMVDPRDEVHARAQVQCPAARVERDFAALVPQVEADAVILCTPPQGREEQVQIACSAGLAILAEKPLADTVELARRYVNRAEAAGVMLMVVLNYRYLAVTAEIRHLMDIRLGRPEFARFTYERWRDGTLPHLNKYPLTMPQPMLWEQSIHHFDLMRHVYQSEPVRVFAKSFHPSWSMYADDANVSAIFEFDNGLVANYQGTWQSSWREHHFEWRTECARGLIVQRNEYGALAFAERGDPALTPVALPPYEQWIDDARSLLAACVAAFRHEIPLPCSGRDHLKSLRMVQACVESSRQGKAINAADMAS
jgi:predicted dehydrogenase